VATEISLLKSLETEPLWGQLSAEFV